MPKKIDDRQEGYIEALLEEGIPQREIIVKFKAKFGRTLGFYTIKRIWSKSRGITKQKTKNKFLRKTSELQDAIILMNIKRNPRLSWKQISLLLLSIYGISVSWQTVARRAHEKQIFGRKMLKKAKLTKRKAQKRLSFAQSKTKWTQKQWEQVVFSDEKKLRLFKANEGGNDYVRIALSERLKPNNVQPKVKFGGGGINFWGCVSKNGVGILKEIEGKLTGEKYKDRKSVV